MRELQHKIEKLRKELVIRDRPKKSEIKSEVDAAKFWQVAREAFLNKDAGLQRAQSIRDQLPPFDFGSTFFCQ